MTNHLFLYPKDLTVIEQISRSTAYRRYSELLFLFNKHAKGKITSKEYCEFHNLELPKVLSVL